MGRLYLLTTRGKPGQLLAPFHFLTRLLYHHHPTSIVLNMEEIVPTWTLVGYNAAGLPLTRVLKDEITTLKREAARKDKALAEALLVLQKKFRALWEEEDK